MGKLWLITTGGTIASRYDATRDATVAGGPRMPELPAVSDCEVLVDPLMFVNSCAMSLQQSFQLADRILHHVLDPECVGVVVTHGTDTMEESAYLADLLIGSDKPVVFTGSQRSADEPQPDGPGNLADALALATSPEARGLGVVIVFAGEVHAARDVTKQHTSRLDAFASPGVGPLGFVDAGDVHVLRRPVLRESFAATGIGSRVELITMVQGMDDRLIRYAAASGAEAIILQGFGRGNANPAIAAAVAEIVATGVPVVVTSRCPEGYVRPVYGNGGGKDLERSGAVFAGDLSGAKARILAAVLIGAGEKGPVFAAAVSRLGGLRR